MTRHQTPVNIGRQVRDSAREGRPTPPVDLGWLLAGSLRSYLLVAERAVAAIPFGYRGYTVVGAVRRWCPGSQLELGRRLLIDKTVMTHLIDSLESAGLVERQPGSADRRARRVVLTAQGESAWHEASGRLAIEEERILDGLSLDQRETLIEALTLFSGQGGCGPVCGEIAEFDGATGEG